MGNGYDRHYEHYGVDMSWTPPSPNWPADAGTSTYTVPPGGADAQPTYTGSGALSLQDFGVSNVTPDQLQNFSHANRAQYYTDSQGNQYNSDGQIVLINRPNGQYSVDPNTGTISNYIAPSHNDGFFGGILNSIGNVLSNPVVDAIGIGLLTGGLGDLGILGSLGGAGLDAGAMTAADYAAGTAATQAALADAGIGTGIDAATAAAAGATEAAASALPAGSVLADGSTVLADGSTILFDGSAGLPAGSIPVANAADAASLAASSTAGALPTTATVTNAAGALPTTTTDAASTLPTTTTTDAQAAAQSQLQGDALNASANPYPTNPVTAGSVLPDGSTVAADGSVISNTGATVAPAGTVPVTSAADSASLASASAAAPAEAAGALPTTEAAAPSATSSLTGNAGQGFQIPNTGTTSLSNIGDNLGINLQEAGQAPNLASMGGAQGITTPIGTAIGDASSFINDAAIAGVPAAGTISATAITPSGALPSLGNPSSFINNPSAYTSPSTTTSSTPISSGAASGGTGSSGGYSSSGPWNAPINPGIAVVGKANTPSMANPLANVLSQSIVPTYSPGNSMLNTIMGHEQQGMFTSATGYKKGGEVKADTSKFEPDFVKVIKERIGGKIDEALRGFDPEFLDVIHKRSGGATPDHHHPNYNGAPLFRTGGLGKHVQGPGTGQSDDIPAMLADGEYVFDADTVSALGDGSNKAGAEALDKMREQIRKHKRSAPVDKIPPKAKQPLQYLKGK